MTFPIGNISKGRLIILGGVLVVIIFLIVAFSNPQNPDTDPNLPKGQIRLVMWGLEEDATALRSVFEAYKNSSKETSQYLVEFKGYASGEELEAALVNALAENKGPDIFYFHNSWLLKHGAKTQPAYTALLNPAGVARLYPQTVSEDFINTTASGTLVHALPLYMDGLGIIYNKDIIDASGVLFDAKTWDSLSWDDFLNIVQETRLVKNGVITRAGTALGSAQNVENFADILSALLLQSETPFIDINGKISFDENAKNAFLFYLQFSNKGSGVYTWDATRENSREEFIKEKTATIVDYYGAYTDIKKKNQFIDARIIPLPQLEINASKKRTHSSYWGLAVSNFSRNKYVSWHFTRFITMNEEANKIFLESAQKLPALTSLMNKSASGPNGPFIKSLLFARTWKQKDPRLTRATFEALVKNVSTGRLDIERAMRSAQETLTQ